MTAREAADEIKRRVTAVQAADRYGLKHDAHGFAVCPFHGDTDPSLKLYPGARGWTCFGCHAGGSVIDLVMRLTDTDFCQAVEKINREFSLGLPLGAPRGALERERARARSAEAAAAAHKRAAALRAAQDDYFDAVNTYITNERAIANGEPAPNGEWGAEFAAALKKRAETIENAARALYALRVVMGKND